jgi:hypothetical protein
MYKKIRKKMETFQKEPLSHPLIEQSFSSAICEELNQFCKWIAALESQIIVSNDSSSSSSKEKIVIEGFSLRRLWVMIRDYKRILNWIFILLETCSGKGNLKSNPLLCLLLFFNSRT